MRFDAIRRRRLRGYEAESCRKSPLIHLVLVERTVDADVMRPDAEAPLVAADEVGVMLSNPQVVERLFLAGVIDLTHWNQPPVMADQQIARLQDASWEPSLIVDKERVLGRGADHLV